MKKCKIKLILEDERKELDKILPSLYGYHLLQLGSNELAECLNSSLISHRVKMNQDLIARDDQLPILSDSIDVVVLSHALECTRGGGLNPHQILREAHRVLIPGGHVVITGFNPYSFLGLKQLVVNPKSIFLSAGRVKDWLSLLNFAVVGGSFFAGAYGIYKAYSVVAVKQVIPLSLIRPNWQKKKLSWATGEVEGAS